MTSWNIQVYCNFLLNPQETKQISLKQAATQVLNPTRLMKIIEFVGEHWVLDQTECLHSAMESILGQLNSNSRMDANGVFIFNPCQYSILQSVQRSNESGDWANSDINIFVFLFRVHFRSANRSNMPYFPCVPWFRIPILVKKKKNSSLSFLYI